jgi:hypothetical protein
MWSQPSNNQQQPKTREATVNNQQQQELQFRFECEFVRKERKKKGGKQQGKLGIGVVVVILCDFCACAWVKSLHSPRRNFAAVLVG